MKATLYRTHSGDNGKVSETEFSSKGEARNYMNEEIKSYSTGSFKVNRIGKDNAIIKFSGWSISYRIE